MKSLFFISASALLLAACSHSDNNDAPRISTIMAQSTYVDNATAPIAFTISDDNDNSGDLSITAVSSNSTLLVNSNIVVGGSGADRNVTLQPATGQSGTSTVTLTVTDRDGRSSNTTFVLTVLSSAADGMVTRDIYARSADAKPMEIVNLDVTNDENEHAYDDLLSAP